MPPFWRAYFSHGWFNHQLEHDEPQTYECNLKNVYFSSRFSYDLWPFEVILVVSRLVSLTEKINHVSAVGVFFGLITLRIFFALRTFRKVEFQNNQENSRQKNMWCFCLQKFFFTHTLSIIIQRTWIEKLSEKGTSIGFLRGRGVVIPLILPKVPQSSPPERLGFPRNTPSPWTPPPKKNPTKTSIKKPTNACSQCHRGEAPGVSGVMRRSWGCTGCGLRNGQVPEPGMVPHTVWKIHCSPKSLGVQSPEFLGIWRPLCSHPWVAAGEHVLQMAWVIWTISWLSELWKLEKCG